MQRLFSLRCDGVILHVRFLSDDRLRQLAENVFVLLDRLVPGLEDRCVTFDHSLPATHWRPPAVTRRRAPAHPPCISGPRERPNRAPLRLRQDLKRRCEAANRAGSLSEGRLRSGSGYRCADHLL